VIFVTEQFFVLPPFYLEAALSPILAMATTLAALCAGVLLGDKLSAKYPGRDNTIMAYAVIVMLATLLLLYVLNRP
jgi:hypothetical protein